MIEVKNLWKYYGSFCAVESFNLEVRPGEIFGLLGANGAGKSTVIKSIVGLTRHDKGAISICGLDADNYSVEAKAKMGYLPENPSYYGKLTGREFLNLAAANYPVEAKAKMGYLPENPSYYGKLTGREFLNLAAALRGKGADKIPELAERFGIRGMLDEQICRYSKGTAQKVGVIQALMHEPPVLIMDEPFTGLDVPARVALKDILRRRAEKECAVLLSMHEVEVAESLCTKVGIMRSGKLAICGSPGGVARATGARNLESAFMSLMG